ncbi:MAG: alpha/beta fold hydrolase [Promethearchaeota archaeon]
MTQQKEKKEITISRPEMRDLGCQKNQFLEKMRKYPRTQVQCQDFITSDSLELFYRTWIPIVNETKMASEPGESNLSSKIIICVHGLHSHGQKFVLLADYFVRNPNTKNWHVFAPDLRGHGLSWNEANIRGDIADFSLWIKDLSEFISFLHSKYPEIPIYIIAESMGAAVSVLTTIKIQNLISALVLLSPALKPFALAEITLIQRSLTYSLIGGVERTNIKERGQGRFSTNSEAYIKYQINDHLRLNKVSPRYYYQVIKMVHQLKPLEFQRFVPSCVFAGDRDVVVDIQGMKEFIRRLGSTDKELHLIPEAFHELLTDLQAMKYHLYEKIVRWISTH